MASAVAHNDFVLTGHADALAPVERHPTFFYDDGTLELTCKSLLFRLHMSRVEYYLTGLYASILEKYGVANSDGVSSTMILTYEIPEEDLKMFLECLRMVYKGFTSSVLSPSNPISLHSYCDLLRVTCRYGGDNLLNVIYRAMCHAAISLREFIHDIAGVSPAEVLLLLRFSNRTGHVDLAAACYFEIAFRRVELQQQLEVAEKIMVRKARQKMIQTLLDRFPSYKAPVAKCTPAVLHSDGPGLGGPTRRSRRRLPQTDTANICMSRTDRQITLFSEALRRAKKCSAAPFDPYQQLLAAMHQISMETCDLCSDMYTQYFFVDIKELLKSLYLYFKLKAKKTKFHRHL